MNLFDRHLRAAAGYLELGMPLDAHEELEQIEPELRDQPGVFIVRLGIHQELKQWQPMIEVANHLCKTRPDEPQWVISLAFATRRARSIQEAMEVLAPAATRFPMEPIVRYNLACYAAQLGHLNAARARLAEAIKLAPECRKMALDDPDLVALREEIK